MTEIQGGTWGAILKYPEIEIKDGKMETAIAHILRAGNLGIVHWQNSLNRLVVAFISKNKKETRIRLWRPRDAVVAGYAMPGAFQLEYQDYTYNSKTGAKEFGEICLWSELPFGSEKTLFDQLPMKELLSQKK